MIYLDNSATTQPYPEVLESFQNASTQFFANPSSIHQLGGRTETLLTRAREQAAELLGINKREIVFTSGGTEGNNLAIKGIALEHQNRGKHIITSQTEDRKSTRLNSSHVSISYAVFCLKKKKKSEKHG